MHFLTRFLNFSCSICVLLLLYNITSGQVRTLTGGDWSGGGWVPSPPTGAAGEAVIIDAAATAVLDHNAPAVRLGSSNVLDSLILEQDSKLIFRGSDNANLYVKYIRIKGGATLEFDGVSPTTSAFRTIFVDSIIVEQDAGGNIGKIVITNGNMTPPYYGINIGTATPGGEGKFIVAPGPGAPATYAGYVNIAATAPFTSRVDVLFDGFGTLGGGSEMILGSLSTNTSTLGDVVSLVGNVNVRGNTSICFLCTLEAGTATGGSYDLTIGGDFIINGSFIPRTGRVIFDGNNDNLLNGGSTTKPLNFYTLVIRKQAGRKITPVVTTTTIYTNNDLIIQSGYLDLSNQSTAAGDTALWVFRDISIAPTGGLNIRKDHLLIGVGRNFYDYNSGLPTPTQGLYFGDVATGQVGFVLSGITCTNCLPPSPTPAPVQEYTTAGDPAYRTYVYNPQIVFFGGITGTNDQTFEGAASIPAPHMIGLIGLNLPSIRIIGSKARKVLMGTSCRVRGSITVTGGEFLTNGKRWIFGDAENDSFIVNTNGIFHADAGSITHMYTESCNNGTRLRVHGGGEVWFLGAYIGREALAGLYWRLQIDGIGTRVRANNSSFYLFSGDGVTIIGATGNPATGVVIDNYPYNFSNCALFPNNASCGFSVGGPAQLTSLRFLQHSQNLTGANAIRNLTCMITYVGTPSGPNAASVMITNGPGVPAFNPGAAPLIEIINTGLPDNPARTEWENDNAGNTNQATTGLIRWSNSNVKYWQSTAAGSDDNWYNSANWASVANPTGNAGVPTENDWVEIWAAGTNLNTVGCTGCGSSNASTARLPRIPATTAADTAKCGNLRIIRGSTDNTQILLRMDMSSGSNRAKLAVYGDVALDGAFRPNDGKIWVTGSWGYSSNAQRFGPDYNGRRGTAAGATGSEVVLNGKSGQFVYGFGGSIEPIFHHLTIEKDSGIVIVNPACRPWGEVGLIVEGNLNLNKGGFSIQTCPSSMRLFGSWANNGGIFIPATKEIEFITPDTATFVRTVKAKPTAAFPTQAFNKVAFLKMPYTGPGVNPPVPASGFPITALGAAPHYLFTTDVSVVDTFYVGVGVTVNINRDNHLYLGDGVAPDFHNVDGTLNVSVPTSMLPAQVMTAGYIGEGGRLALSDKSVMRIRRRGRLNLLGTNPQQCMLTRTYNNGYYRIHAQDSSIVSAKYVKCDYIRSFQMGRRDVSVNATRVNGNNILRNVDHTGGLMNGMLVVGPGIPAGTYITNFSPTSVTMSNNATSAGTGMTSFLNKFVGNITAGSNTITGITSPTPANCGLQPGMYIQSNRFPANTRITAVGANSVTLSSNALSTAASDSVRYNAYAVIDDANPFNNSVFRNGAPNGEPYLYLPLTSNAVLPPVPASAGALAPGTDRTWFIQDLAFIETKSPGFNVRFNGQDSLNENVIIYNSFGQYSGPGFDPDPLTPSTPGTVSYEWEENNNDQLYNFSSIPAKEAQIANRYLGTIKWIDDPAPYRWRGGFLTTGDSLWTNPNNWYTSSCGTPAATPPTQNDVVLLDHTCVNYPYTVVVPAMGDNPNRRANCVRLRINSNIGNSVLPIRLILGVNDGLVSGTLYDHTAQDPGLITPAYVGTPAGYPPFGTLPNYDATSGGAAFNYDGGNIKIWGNTSGGGASQNITAVLSMETDRDTVILERQSQLEINVGGFYVPKQGCYVADSISHTLFQGEGSTITSAGNKFGDVTINANGTFTLEDPMSCMGKHFRIDKGTFDVGPGNNTLSIWGSWTNNSLFGSSRFNPRNGAVRLEGPRKQRLTRSTATHPNHPTLGIPDFTTYERFWNLYLDKTSDTLDYENNIVEMDNSTNTIYIAKGLFLSKGILRTNTGSNNVTPYPRRVIIDPLGTAAWANVNSFVEGKLSYVFDNSVVTKTRIYEVGKGKDYAPFELSLKISRPDSVEFIGEAFKANPSTLGPVIGDALPLNSTVTGSGVLNPDPTSTPLVPGFCDTNSPGWTGPLLPIMSEKLNKLVGNHYWRLSRSKSNTSLLIPSIGSSTGAGTGFSEGKVRLYWQTNDSMACPTYPNATVCCGGGNLPTFLNFMRVAHVRADGASWENQGAANATGAIAAGQLDNSIQFKGNGTASTPTSTEWGSSAAILKTAAADVGAGYFAFGVVEIPLPVEALRFSAEYVNGQTLLRWQTLNERQNAGFMLSRSADAPVGFERFASYREYPALLGQGTRAGQFDYQFTDVRELEAGRTYYFRLEAVDFNGNVSRSEIREIRVPYGFGFTAVYPNPTQNSSVVNFNLAESGAVDLSVYDASGREVAKLINGNLAAGSHRVEIEGKKFGAGVYLLILKTAQGTDQRKWVVQ